MRPGSVGCVRNRRRLCHPVSPTPRGCQPAGVQGPAQHIRCQARATAARAGAVLRGLALSPFRRMAGLARRGRAPASRQTVAGLVAGLRESVPDAGILPSPLAISASQQIPGQAESLPLTQQRGQLG